MRYFIKIQYYGPAFHGSQIQGEQETVQLQINRAISILLKQEIQSFGASRTDSQVHANASFFHFDTSEQLSAHFAYKMNALLPPEIAVVDLYITLQSDANARFDAVSRSYTYHIYTQKNPFLNQRAWFYPFKIDRDLLNTTAEILKEYTDFESFSKRNNQSFTYLCSIYESKWEFEENKFSYSVKANRFLRGMVRALVATQLQVARGKMSIADFRKAIEAKDCTQVDFSAPGYGLFLMDIEYPDGLLKKLE